MSIILNTSAAAGNAEKKWNSIKDLIREKFNNVTIIDVYKNASVEKIKQDILNNGNANLIIAGGDGTVNYFINKLIEVLDEKEIKKIKIGVIGIGSSNDFCKPSAQEIFINSIPCKINFDNTQLRDVGILKYKSGSQILQKHFLLNASVGVTAEVNKLFNNPDPILKFLKKYFMKLAIIHAALKTIFLYNNFYSKIVFDSYETYSFPVSNLSIIKSPNISGDLSYPGEADYQNGLYCIYLAHSMNRLGLINLLKSLSKKVFPKSEQTMYCETPKIKVTAGQDFLIEFDGEIISTN
jgi:diacylglycerol kinase family enzyme